jgi:hypothetical protein
MRIALHNTFKYPVAKLLEALKVNRENHLKEYTNAWANYTHLLKEELLSLTAKVVEGKEIEHTIRLRKPERHDKEYDQAIRMLELTSETEVDIDGQTFAKLVMDEWEWQQSFTANTLSYTGAAGNHRT